MYVKALAISLLIVIPVCTGFGQTRPVIPPKAEKLYEKARQAQQKGDLANAGQLLRSALDVAPQYLDAWVFLGDLHMQQDRTAEALNAYEQALAVSADYRPLVWLLAAGAAMELGRFADAAEKLRRYLALNPRNERQRLSAEKLLAQAEFAARAVQTPVPFEPHPLGPAVNSPLPEYLPSLSADALTLIFTRVVDGQEDFYIVQRAAPHAPWQTAESLLALNTPMNEGAHCLSADGSTLVFTACNQPGGLGSCDLYISVQRNGQWTSPRNLGPPVNTEGYETQPTLSADGRTLIFTSRRPGGQGNNDLWQSTRKPDGSWGQPVNLGSVINTPEDEQAPFLHPDGRTLYFMSKGHPGMGEFDLFYSRKNAQGQWLPPVNLGFPINTPRNEGALVVSADGRTAYFARDQEEAKAVASPTPLTDIYTFELYPEARPAPVTYARGKVRNARTGAPLQALVRIEMLEDTLEGYSITSGEDGSFFLCLPLGADYAFSVEQEGFLFFSEHFELREQRQVAQPYELDITLQPVQQAAATPEPGTPVVLRNLFFATGSAEIQPASWSELDRLLRLLQDNPALRIQINGHTDDVGSEADNLQLSTRRAAAIYQFLLDKGIPESRLQYRGFGESQPLAPNDSPENRQRNRRTEFVVLDR